MFFLITLCQHKLIDPSKIGAAGIFVTFCKHNILPLGSVPAPQFIATEEELSLDVVFADND